MRFPTSRRARRRALRPVDRAPAAQAPCAISSAEGTDGQLVRARVADPFPWARSAIVCFANYNSAEPRSTDPARARRRLDCSLRLQQPQRCSRAAADPAIITRCSRSASTALEAATARRTRRLRSPRLRRHRPASSSARWPSPPASAGPARIPASFIPSSARLDFSPSCSPLCRRKTKQRPCACRTAAAPAAAASMPAPPARSSRPTDGRHALHLLPHHRAQGPDRGRARCKAWAARSSAATSARTSARGIAKLRRSPSRPRSRAARRARQSRARLAGLARRSRLRASSSTARRSAAPASTDCGATSPSPWATPASPTLRRNSKPGPPPQTKPSAPPPKVLS